MLFSFFVFMLGLCVGSFLNVVICRLETKEPLVFPRSHCPKCQSVLKWYELVPVFSFILQKGKCRHCRKKISFQYPLIEISTGILFLLIVRYGLAEFTLQPAGKFLINYENLLTLAYQLVIVSFLIVIFVYDLKHYIIPDKIIYPGIAIVLVFYLIISPLTGYRLLLARILVAFAAGAFFLGLVLISRGRWLGLGDVKLVFLMGLVLGWPNILVALFAAFMSGAALGLVLILAGKKTIKSRVPFGPFLCGATLFSLFFGQNVVEWYLRLI